MNFPSLILEIFSKINQIITVIFYGKLCLRRNWKKLSANDATSTYIWYKTTTEASLGEEQQRSQVRNSNHIISLPYKYIQTCLHWKIVPDEKLNKAPIIVDKVIVDKVKMSGKNGENAGYHIFSFFLRYYKKLL